MARVHTIRIYVHCIDSNEDPHGGTFVVPMSSDSEIADLAWAATKRCPQILDRFPVGILKVWKLKQPVNIHANAAFSTDVDRILRNFPLVGTFQGNDHVQQLYITDIIGQHFTGGRTLQAFIEFPADKANNRVGRRVDSNLLSQYESMFITLRNFKVWTIDDVNDNGIRKAGKIPPFVEEYERMLGTKRRVPINLLPSASLIPECCDAPGSGAQGANINTMTEAELHHLASIASFEPSKCWERKGRQPAFKQLDATWLLFYSIALRYGPDEEVGGISVKVGEDPWPFQIIVQDNEKECRSYGPKNDFTALGSSLPRLLIEVNSFPPDQPPQDHYRMLLQAASVIRFANQFLEAYRMNKSCILVAAHIGSNGNTERYILFQDSKKDPRLVYYKRKIFRFKERVDRILFALELYNFFSGLDKEGYDEDTFNKIEAFEGSINDHRSAHGMKSLTSDRKRRCTGERNNRDSDDRGNGGGGDAGEEQLENHGYVMIPDFFEDKGGRMEPLIKLPLHIRTVYRSTDTTKTELVAKHVDNESMELEVLKYLRTIQPQSSRIISLIDTVPTNTGEWAILPKMRTVRGDLSIFSDALRCGKLTQLGWDLIEGLAYLHSHGVAHLDIKPGNLVYTDDFRLQIIDFNSAVRVRSEDDMVEGVYGTRGWMAPEIVEQSVCSPIRADWWSCGKVILCFLETSGTEDGDLGRLAEQLMDDNPLHRPSLVNWSERVDVMLCDDDDTGEVDEDGNKESKVQVKDEVRGDGGLENRTKRRRVDVGLRVDEYHGLPAVV